MKVRSKFTRLFQIAYILNVESIEDLSLIEVLFLLSSYQRTIIYMILSLNARTIIFWLRVKFKIFYD